ncbi:Rieske 2Fe-2S domain-containing protein [Enhygromyxa salina]|uniref:Aminopyrrolnitrin oxygenase PrnD n=1 Tax=Enhygromyxa salina TaxID=215803 RepID=A0A2S9YN34_9BACT|nr:Rieske 2Fe-2S domain-containing protein [Enhygromyxa salina]PRQ06495.1 Aminopyrrolnitrin oxygenase PrnD [Enhygromyxa salina]
MIPNEWYAVVESSRVRNQPLGLERLGQNIVLFRRPSGEIACLPDRCPHRGAKLSPGRISQGCIQCPFHGFLYDGDGVCRHVPANGADRPVPKGLRLDPFPTREAHGLIWIWWGERRDVYPEVPWFPQDDEASAVEGSRVYDFNYSRFIENTMDAHHIPFVHGALQYVGKLIDPFEASFDGDVIRVLTGLKRDRAQPDEEAMTFDMRFKFPNVFFTTYLRAGEPKLRLIQVSTPVDEQRTWLYVRMYQRLSRLPIVGRTLSRMIMRVDGKIAQEVQDFAIFRTQTPAKPSLDCDYTLIVADRGIYYYLAERERRIAAAAT